MHLKNPNPSEHDSAELGLWVLMHATNLIGIEARLSHQSYTGHAKRGSIMVNKKLIKKLIFI